MNRKHAIILFLSLLIACAAGSPATVSAAEFQSRTVTSDVAVLHPDLQVRDVTDLYSGRSRADGDHFITVAGIGTDQYPTETILTSDEGAVMVGANFSDSSASDDALILKYDSTGSVLWARTVGGAEVDYFQGVSETVDGGYVCAGYSASYGSGEVQILLVKFSSSGVVQWARIVGGGVTDAAFGVHAADDGTITVAGYTKSYGADVTDVLMMAFDNSGTLLWCTMGIAASDTRLNSLQPTSDGGFISAGWTAVTGSLQCLLVKFTAGGPISWSATVGDSGFNWGRDAAETPDGGFLLTGITSAYDPYGTYDVILAKFSSTGTLNWARSLGVGNNSEVGYSIKVNDDGGFAIAGGTDISSGALGDAFLLNFDSGGSLQWARTIGGDQEDIARHLLLTSGDGYVLTCPTRSFGAGGWDVMLAALNEDGIVPGCEYTQTWQITSPLRTPAWSIVTLAEIPLSPTVQALTLTPIDIPYLEETICDYQKPETEYWLVASGRSDSDWAGAIGRTPDKGYLVAAEAWAGIYNTDVLLLKYDARGNLQWAREAGGEFDDIPRDLLVTDDGGCIVAGSTSSYGAGLDDALLMGFDPGGNLLWTSVTGGAQFDRLWSIHEKPDGYFLAVGCTESYGEGLFDLLAVEVTPEGTVPSVRVLGTSQNEVGLRGIPLSGGGSLIAGYSNADGGDQEAIAVRMEDDGSFTWCSRSGSAGNERYYGIAELPGGELLLGGYTTSYGDTDILLVKLASNGARQWFRTVGTANHEYLLDLKPTGDGGAAGCGKISQARGAYYDALLCLFDSEGQALWAHRMGDSYEDNFDALVVDEDGFAAAGSTGSFGLTNVEAFVTRTDRDGMVRDCPWISSEVLTTSDRYPPGGGYTMTSSAISPSLENPFVENWGIVPSHLELCRALPLTISANITSVPSVGMVPFNTLMSVYLTNNYGEQIRRMAARIHLTLGNGAYFPNWHAGFTNIAPGNNYTTSWSQNIPALGTVIGENHFHLVAEDVTPSPYNQPPYPPAGDTDSGLQIVVATSP